MSDTQRNFLIIALIAVVAVAFSTQGSIAIGSANLLLSIMFTVMILAAMWIWHRNHATEISSMPRTYRWMLQGCGIMLAVVFVTGMSFPAWSVTNGALGVLLFFALLGAFGYGCWFAWNQRPFKGNRFRR